MSLLRTKVVACWRSNPLTQVEFFLLHIIVIKINFDAGRSAMVFASSCFSRVKARCLNDCMEALTYVCLLLYYSQFPMVDSYKY